MNLATTLRLAGMTRGHFDTLNHRGFLAFMAKDVGDDTKHDRYDYRHAIALATFVQLRDLGLAPRNAAEAVSDSWRDISAVAAGETPKQPLCGVRKNQLGVFESLGWPRKDTDVSRCISGTWVSIPEVFSIVREVEARERAGAE